MKNLINRMANNPVAANILLMFIILGGIYSGINIPQEVFPEIEQNRITISASYPGAGPSEVIEAICKPVELAISEINGIEEVVSLAKEENASLNIELKKGSDIQEVLQDIKNSVDSINNFPSDVSEVLVSRVIRRRELMNLVLYGKIPSPILFDFANQIKEELLTIEGVSYIEISGDLPRELLIEVTPESLNQYNLTLGNLAALVKKVSFDIPAGSVKVGASHILLTTSSKKSTPHELGKIVIDHNEDGTVLTLAEIATIRETLQESDTMAVFDGESAVIFDIYQEKDSTPSTLSKSEHFGRICQLSGEVSARCSCCTVTHRPAATNTVAAETRRMYSVLYLMYLYNVNNHGTISRKKFLFGRG